MTPTAAMTRRSSPSERGPRADEKPTEHARTTRAFGSASKSTGRQRACREFNKRVKRPPLAFESLLATRSLPNGWPLSCGRHGAYHGRPAPGNPDQHPRSVAPALFGRQLQRLVGRRPAFRGSATLACEQIWTAIVLHSNDTSFLINRCTPQLTTEAGRSWSRTTRSRWMPRPLNRILIVKALNSDIVKFGEHK